MLGLCSFIIDESEDFYKDIYYKEYCKAPMYTFDGIQVFFDEHKFEHAFYESMNRKQKDKSLFSYKRANRIYWIKWTLQNPNSELYVGWDNDAKTYDNYKRVAVTFGDYAVVIGLNRLNNKKAKFITAYVADGINVRGEKAIDLIRRGNKWK